MKKPPAPAPKSGNRRVRLILVLKALSFLIMWVWVSPLNGQVSEIDLNAPEFEITGLSSERRMLKGMVHIDLMPALGETSKIQLTPGDMDWSIIFGKMNQAGQAPRSFAYKIDRVQPAWVEHHSDTLTLRGMVFGEYTLHLKLLQPDGQYSEETTYQVNSMTPFFWTPWYRMKNYVYLSIGLIVIFSIRIYFINKGKKRLKTEVAEKTSELQDKSEALQRQATELKKLDVAKSQFFANISHEFRTPLTLIIGPLRDLLKSENKDDPKTAVLSRMYRNSRHLQNLTEEVLMLSKLETSKLEITNSPINLLQFLKRTTASFESYAETKGIRYQLETDIDAAVVVALDIKKVEKVINNLISNALKFTERDHEVTVTAVIEDQLTITVRDTGKGIEAEHLPNIFDRFYQSPTNSPEEIQGGTGIGLALAKELTTAMKGEISVESESGKGTVFTLNLPLTVMATEALDLDEDDFDFKDNRDAASPEAQTDMPKVLLVEDNTDMRSYIKGLLHDHYHITEANNGAHALEVLNKLRPDLIISDVMMPEMDGFTFLENLRASEKQAAIPVIMLTARAEQDDKLKALTIGVDDYLTKPFVSEELLVRVKNIINNKLGRAGNGTDEAGSITPEIEDTLSSVIDINWMKKVEASASSRIGDHDFSVDSLAEELALSTRQFQRKIKQITGLTSTQYLQELRLQIARQGLERQDFRTVQEAAQAVGLQSAKYFSKLFKARFGKLPSELLA
ncbi:MAG: response regulator [Roseivirga sp.]|nr:response regulator [Roseivirga sp.]